MATYVFGDIHGCFEEFQRLLAQIEFDGQRDRLWHVGDLVNGGPDSLATLRWFAAHDEVVTTVLGNHDLHLIAVALGVHRKRPKDTFDPLLEAADRSSLMEWLRHRPMMVTQGDWAMVHAGLLPAWTIADACERAREIEELLRSTQPEQLLAVMYGNRPRCLSDVKSVEGRWRLTINAMTRMRVLNADGRLNFGYKSTYDEMPEGAYAWFDAPDRRWTDHRVICGHWSALGVRRTPRIVSLDSGCRWGNQLSAFRLDDGTLFQVDSAQSR